MIKKDMGKLHKKKKRIWKNKISKKIKNKKK